MGMPARYKILNIRLKLPGLMEKMEGQVAWTRLIAEAGRPPGARPFV